MIIEGVHSDWCNIEPGVPQGSVLSLLLFLIYMNDLPNTITSNCFLFADDCLLLEKVQSPGDCASKLNHKLSLMYKIVFKLAPPYLCDLCPDFVSDRSCYSLRSANNLCVPYVRKSFLFSSIKWWNSLSLEIRMSSLDIFKHSLLKYLQFPSRNYLFYIGDRSGSISHTRLRLNFSALKHHLFQKNCCLSPACTLCDAPVEDPKHYFLYCMKICLPPLHNYLEIDGIVLLI